MIITSAVNVLMLECVSCLFNIEQEYINICEFRYLSLRGGLVRQVISIRVRYKIHN